MRRLAALVENDVRQQLRFGFYVIYAVVCLAYIGALTALPQAALSLALPLVVFSDPAALGFFFVGGLLLLERTDGTLQALAVTPARLREVLAARVLSLTAIALLTTVVVVLAVGAQVRWPLLLATVAVTSAFNVFIGVAVVARARTVSQYFAWSTLVATPLFLPAAAFLWAPEAPALLAFPTTASLRLIASATGGADALAPGLAAAGLAGLVAATALAGLIAERRLARALREGM